MDDRREALHPVALLRLLVLAVLVCVLISSPALANKKYADKGYPGQYETQFE